MENCQRTLVVCRRADSTVEHGRGDSAIFLARAVVALELGRSFSYVTIDRFEDSDGHVRFYKDRSPWTPGVSLTKCQRARCNQRMKIICAGPLVETVVTGQIRLFGRGWHAQDLNSIDRLCRATYPDGSSEALYRHYDRMLEATQKLLERPEDWVQVEALAIALLLHETIDGKWARGLCGYPRARARQNCRLWSYRPCTPTVKSQSCQL
jgi:hypothetical protein